MDGVQGRIRSNRVRRRRRCKLHVRPNQPVSLLVCSLVHNLPLCIGVKPCCCAPDAVPKRYKRLKAGNESFYLGIVKDNAPTLVPKHVAGKVRVLAYQEIRSDVDQLWFYAERLAYRLIDLVPR